MGKVTMYYYSTVVISSQLFEMCCLLTSTHHGAGQRMAPAQLVRDVRPFLGL